MTVDNYVWANEPSPEPSFSLVPKSFVGREISHHCKHPRVTSEGAAQICPVNSSLNGEAKRLQCKASKYTCSKFKTVEISCDPLGWICYPGRNFCPIHGSFAWHYEELSTFFFFLLVNRELKNNNKQKTQATQQFKTSGERKTQELTGHSSAIASMCRRNQWNKYSLSNRYKNKPPEVHNSLHLCLKLTQSKEGKMSQNY